jgi:hypothetical protein
MVPHLVYAHINVLNRIILNNRNMIPIISALRYRPTRMPSIPVTKDAPARIIG